MISHKYKCIFINVPKTGGKSIKSVLSLHKTHSPLFLDKEKNPEIFSEYFKFAFVRNPWDRLVSVFFYLSKGGEPGSAQDQRSKEDYLKPYNYNFKDFIGGLNKKNIWNQVHLIPQYFWICDRSNNIINNFLKKCRTNMVFTNHNKDIRTQITNFIPMIVNIDKPNSILLDFLGKFENINEDWKKICKKLNMEYAALPHINKSSHKHYTNYYDDKTRKKVASLYAKDIGLFEYKF